MVTQDLLPSYEGLHDQPLCALQSRRVVLRAVGMAGQALCKLVSQRALHRAGKGLAVTVEGRTNRWGLSAGGNNDSPLLSFFRLCVYILTTEYSLTFSRGSVPCQCVPVTHGSSSESDSHIRALLKSWMWRNTWLYLKAQPQWRRKAWPFSFFILLIYILLKYSWLILF